MITANELIEAFARNQGIVKNQNKGLTHADSVLQPPVRGNCMNWVVGHIVENRNGLMPLLGQEPLLTEAQCQRYGYGSEPVLCDGSDVLKLEELLRLLDVGQERLEAALGAITAEELAKPVQSFMGTTSLSYLLFFRYFHETYHVGQTELLRQLAGTNDGVL